MQNRVCRCDTCCPSPVRRLNAPFLDQYMLTMPKELWTYKHLHYSKISRYTGTTRDRGVPRILVGGFLVVAKDTARKACGEILQNNAHQLAKTILGWKLYENTDMQGHGLGRLGYRNESNARQTFHLQPVAVQC